jgi:hypothetical protein
MPLSGEAKTIYQRTYMRDYMRRRRAQDKAQRPSRHATAEQRLTEAWQKVAVTAKAPAPPPPPEPGPSIVRPEQSALTDPAEHAVINGVLDFADAQTQPQLCLYRLISRLQAAYQRRQQAH